MPAGEKETIFTSKVKSTGIFSFKDFYKFCYTWLVDEGGFDITEEKYKEKLVGNSKNLEIVWVATKKVTDYFKYEIKITFKIEELTDVEVTKNGAKTKTNKGAVEIGVVGTLIRDYDGKFDKDAFRKFLRGIYEKYVVQSRIKEFETKLIVICNEFLEQAKAYLDLEGKK